MIYSLLPDINKNPLFSGVSREHVKKYFNDESLLLRELSPNTVAYSSQSSAIQVAIILEGSARVYTGEGDEKALIRTLNTGDIFGIANLYDAKDPFPTRIITATHARILFIEGSAFKTFIENDKVANKNYIRFLSKKIIYLNRKLTTLTAGSAEKKLASHIYEHQVDGIFSVSSLSELAKVLQMGRASLYRSIDSLIESRIIDRAGKTFTIKNHNALKNYINKN